MDSFFFFYNLIFMRKMSRYLLFLLLFITLVYNKAQSIRFEYELNCKNDTLSKSFQKFNTALEITPTEKKYYDMDVYRYDSIQSGQANMTTNFSQNLLKLKSDQINQTFHRIFEDWYKIKSEDKFSWKIIEEKKKEKNYNLQKAITNFGGREWSAWFTTDIPIPEGPYKFGGLPGLIVEIYDSKNHYHYNLVKITKLSKSSDTSNILENRKGQKAIDVTLKTYNKLLLDYYNEPFKNLITNSNNFEYYDSTIKKRYTRTDELREARINEQKRIKKYYNPIELDKAISYPK